jgi:hypothetical protein
VLFRNLTGGTEENDKKTPVLPLRAIIIIIIIIITLMALALKRTIPIERPPLVGEVTANFCG